MFYTMRMCTNIRLSHVVGLRFIGTTSASLCTKWKKLYASKCFHTWSFDVRCDSVTEYVCCTAKKSVFHHMRIHLLHRCRNVSSAPCTQLRNFGRAASLRQTPTRVFHLLISMKRSFPWRNASTPRSAQCCSARTSRSSPVSPLFSSPKACGTVLLAHNGILSSAKRSIAHSHTRIYLLQGSAQKLFSAKEEGSALIYGDLRGTLSN